MRQLHSVIEMATDENTSDTEYKLAISDDQVIYEKNPSDVRKMEQIVGLAPRELLPANTSDNLNIEVRGFILKNFQLVSVHTGGGFIERYPRYESFFIALTTKGSLECITEHEYLQAGLLTPIKAFTQPPIDW